MTEPQPDATVQAIFTALTIERGGVESLSVLHTELCATVARLLASISAAPAEDVARLADSVGKLLTQLPPPTTPTAGPLNLANLSDADLLALEKIYRKADGEPPAVEPEPIERERGRGEIAAETLGRWVDAKETTWAFRALTPDEENEARNLLQQICGPHVIARNLWKNVFLGDLQGEIERAVKSALAFAGKSGDTKLVANEPAAATPAPPADIHDVAKGALTATSDYSFLNAGSGRGHFGDNRG